MTYKELTDTLNIFGMSYDSVDSYGSYGVFYKNDGFCVVKRTKKANRSRIAFLSNKNWYYKDTFIRDIPLNDLIDKINDFTLKYKKNKMTRAIERLNRDFI